MDEDELIKTGMEVALRPITDIADDALGWVIGDWLKQKRKNNRERLQQDAKKKLKDRGIVEPAEPAPAEIMPLIIAAQDETNEKLSDLWASLTATLLNPKSKHLFRREFVGIAKQLEALDVGTLPLLETSANMSPSRQQVIADRLQVSVDEVLNSFRNLLRLELTETNTLSNSQITPSLTSLGRQFLRAVRGV